jgi:hypothetical protein
MRQTALDKTGTVCCYSYPVLCEVQGGSDKSGIFFFFLLNGTAQLKTSRFY